MKGARTAIAMAGLRRAGLAALVLAAGSVPVWAEKPVIDFRPPDIEAARVCEERKSDDLLRLQWSAWDGQRLPPGMDYRALDNELARLRRVDAVAFFDTIKNAYNLRVESDPYYSRAAYLLDMISLYVAAERFADLRETGFVAELEAIGPAASPAVVNFLADLYLDGRAVAENQQKGLQHKLQAAYNGNPNAVLDLAELTASGTVVPGWEMTPNWPLHSVFRLCSAISTAAYASACSGSPGHSKPAMRSHRTTQLPSCGIVLPPNWAMPTRPGRLRATIWPAMRSSGMIRCSCVT
nr:hypothetical protein [Marinicella sp. W31]MDC2878129.1 hypothetical protein [Marinicella sp. W31]